MPIPGRGTGREPTGPNQGGLINSRFAPDNEFGRDSDGRICDIIPDVAVVARPIHVIAVGCVERNPQEDSDASPD